MIKNNKGIALITVLILSVIALALVGITLSLVRYSTNVSGTYGVYKSALEAAKGGVDYSISKLLNADCDNSSYVVIDNNSVGNGGLVSNLTLGEYQVKSTLLDKSYYPTIDTSTGTINDHCIYTIETQAVSINGKDKSIIDVIVRVE